MSKQESPEKENEENVVNDEKEDIIEIKDEKENAPDEENSKNEVDVAESKEEEENEEVEPQEDNNDSPQENYTNRKLNKKRKREEDQLPMIEGETEVFIAKMKECVDKDLKSRAEKKPALEKMKFVHSLEKFLSNHLYHEEFLKQKGLEVLENWIKTNPDGSFPSLNQINIILDLLSNITCITREYLEAGHIGAQVMNLSKNMKYSQQIKKKASELLSRWFRVLYDININYNDTELENYGYKKAFLMRSKDKNEEEEEEESEEEENGEEEKNKGEEITFENAKEYEIYHTARIPKRGLFDFTKKPVSLIDESNNNYTNKIWMNNFFDKRNKNKKRKYNK